MCERLTTPLDEAIDVAEVGGKARALARLRAAGVPAPDGIVLTTAAYRSFVGDHGLRERVALELSRRPLSELRHEETWDVALRVHALFMSATWPTQLRRTVAESLESLVDAGPVVVRSSAPHEDAATASFAGLHESVVGVTSLDGMLDAVRSVWASLFTDRALLYHDELALDPTRSSMAVLVQPLVDAQRAGVAFTRSPDDPQQGVIEAVWGLGEGLVSGRIEPDTWLVERDSGRIASHRTPVRTRWLARVSDGPAEQALPAERASAAPLTDAEVGTVWRAAMNAERLFDEATDCEWVIDGDDALVMTQARPITTARADARSAYLATQGSVEVLEALRERIEDDLMPAMVHDAELMAASDLEGASDAELIAEASRRAEAVTRWRFEYRSAMIPFAHGARLLGRAYADAMRPDDPFDYLTLLVRSPAEYETHQALLRELGSTAEVPAPDDSRRVEAEARFLAAFGTIEKRESAARLLELARASWRLRDDDNLYLALVEREADRAAAVLRRRLVRRADVHLAAALAQLEALADDSVDSNRARPAAMPSAVRPRQLLGQPAGPGVGTGVARVVRCIDDLLLVDPGDIVVADALEPETAAYAARAAGIVERRGGMLVHGAIVAREHGVPCVTGVADATALIRSGERLTVDGYLGIVVLDDV